MDDPAITLIDHGADGEYQARVADSLSLIHI